MKKKHQPKKRQPNFPPLGEQILQQMADVLARWPGTEEYEAAIKSSGVRPVVRPGGDARGKQKSDVADKWRKPAAALAEKIWQESPDLLIAIVGQRIRKLLPEDKQPP